MKFLLLAVLAALAFAAFVSTPVEGRLREGECSGECHVGDCATTHDHARMDSEVEAAKG